MVRKKVNEIDIITGILEAHSPVGMSGKTVNYSTLSVGESINTLVKYGVLQVVGMLKVTRGEDDTVVDCARLNAYQGLRSEALELDANLVIVTKEETEWIVNKNRYAHGVKGCSDPTLCSPIPNVTLEGLACKYTRNE